MIDIFGDSFLGRALSFMFAPALGLGIGGKKKDEGGGAQATVINPVPDPMFDYSDPTFRKQQPHLATSSDLLTQTMQDFMAGKEPQWYKQIADVVQGNQLDTLRQQYVGTAGDRSGSILNDAMASGAMMGVGPGANQAFLRKGMRDYLTKAVDIENAIANARLQNASSMALNYPQTAAGMPTQQRTSMPSYIPPVQTQQSSGGWGTMLGTGLATLSGAFPGWGGAAAGAVKSFMNPAQMITTTGNSMSPNASMTGVYNK